MGNNQPTNSPNRNAYDPEELMRMFFGNEYNPGSINWDALSLAAQDREGFICEAYNKRRYISDIITLLKNKVRQLTVNQLIALSDQEHRLLTELLFKIPFAELEKKFGKWALYYLFLVSYCYGRGYKQLQEHLETHYGQRICNHLEVARYGSWRINYQSLALTQQFTVLAMLQTGEITTKQLTHHLSHNFELQYLQLANDRAHHGWTQGYEPIAHGGKIHTYAGAGMHPNIRADGPICIALLYKKQPIAIVSGYVCEDSSFMINQMQKVSYDYYDLHGRCIKHAVHPIAQDNSIPRQQTLFGVMKQFVSHYGITSLSIQGAANNRRTRELQTIIDLTEPRRQKPLPNTCHLSPELAHQIYDCFAQQQGMIKNNQNNRIQKKKA